MLIFYIICGAAVFALSSFLFFRNRLAIYRRRIIQALAEKTGQKPYILSKLQEQKIKQCFLEGLSLQECTKQL